MTKVSEEETFEDNKALWWSPDSSRLVYGVFDDTNVDILLLPRSTFSYLSSFDTHQHVWL